MPPISTAGLDGLIWIADKTADETVRLAVPETAPNVAVIIVCPGATALDTPFAAMVAVPAEEEVQLTDPVRFCWLPSLKLPMAVKGCVVPETIVGFAGLTAMDISVTEFTVKTVDPLTELDAAVIVACPAPIQVACPFVATVATVGADVVQFTIVVRFCCVPSLKVPVAVSGCTVPMSDDGFRGLT